MRLTFLGTGTSTGVPQVGCRCAVCTSSDVRDKRLRCSALLETEAGTHILIDCGPDFRQQMLSQTFRPIDGVLITHLHYDHVGGLDDLRPFSVFGEVNIYGEQSSLDHVRESMPYCFVTHKYPGVPNINLNLIQPRQSFYIKEQCVQPVRVMHGRLPILGFRFGNLAYITDMKTIEDDALDDLKGVRTLVVNGLRYEPHGSHQTIPDAIHLSEQIDAERTYLIHMSHQAGLHDEVQAKLPKGIFLAYDGLAIDC